MARSAYTLVRTADAMGLLGERDIERLDSDSVADVVRKLRKARIGQDATLALTLEEIKRQKASEPQEHPRLMRVLEQLQEALEGSPAPLPEWKKLKGVLGYELLSELVGVSPSSVRRYVTGLRTTPDDAADRLHFLALVAGDLAGGYNEIGIRRWFVRRRELLNGKAPRDLLRGEWRPDDEGPRSVRRLARSLAGSGAT